MDMELLLLLYIISAALPVTATAEYAKCGVKYDLNQCYSYGDISARNKMIKTPDICKKTFNISTLKMEPYNIMQIQMLLRTCCGDQFKSTEVNVFYNLSSMTSAKINTSHFIFPIIGIPGMNELFGHYFIPFVRLPTLYYITEIEDNAILKLIKSSLKMWPMLFVFICLTAISGFICWLIETWGNQEEFPRSFVIGWFEGFWWSFISMTTVGYGDKCPKSVLARVFAVLWILFGVCTFSIIVGLFSSKMAEVNYPKDPDMAGWKVAALKHRVYDASAIAIHGGILVDVEAENTTMSILEMFKKLKNKEIHGLILDRYTYIMFSMYASDKLRDNEIFHYMKTKTKTSEKDYHGVKPMLGILVKHKEDYEFFAEFILHNTPVINTCFGLSINRILHKENPTADEEVTDALLSPRTNYYWLLSSFIGVVLICCFGLFYEIRRKRKGKEKGSYSIGTLRSKISEAFI